jgi:predicted nucleic acid-binding protein
MAGAGRPRGDVGRLALSLATFLADKSALTRRDTRPEVREALEPLLLAGEDVACGIVELELLYSATSRATYRALSEVLRGMPRGSVA